MSIDLIAGIVRVLDLEEETVGTGFVITANGLIVTCAHVIHDAGSIPGDKVRLIFQVNGEQRDATVEPEYWSEPDAQDVAILRLEGAIPPDVTFLPLGNSFGLEGQIISTFGFPKAKQYEGLPGKCEVIGNTSDGGFKVLALRSNEVSLGFSGAPLWDSKLQVVVGMITSIIGTTPVGKDDIRPYDPGGRQTETAFSILVETIRDICPELYLPDRSPFRGLEVFKDKHAEFYFGRDAATKELLEMLEQRDFVAVVGLSGSGKSSLVQAGLEKGLKKSATPGLAELPRRLFKPGKSPLLNLLLCVAQLPGQTLEEVISSLDLPIDVSSERSTALLQLRKTITALSPKLIATALQNCLQQTGAILVVDQFERIYTSCEDKNARHQFIETLLATTNDRVKVLITLRADLYSTALEHAALAHAIKSGQLTLLPMSEDELRQVIIEPAKALRRGFQPGLVDRLVFDLEGSPGNLPLLEFALTELWKRDSEKGVLTVESYEALGYSEPDGKHYSGVQGAIARQAELVWRDLSTIERKAARFVFLKLITPGLIDDQGRQIAKDTSRQAWKDEWNESVTHQVVEKLVAARLLTKGQDPFTSQPTVEVAHEALIQAWPRLQQWIKACKPFLNWYTRELIPRMQDWLAEDKDQSYLLRSLKLEQANQWLQEYSDEISETANEYIQTSIALQQQSDIEQKRRRHKLVLGVVLIVFVISIFAGTTFLKWQEAEIGQVNALSASSKAFLISGRKFDALLVDLKAARKLKSVYWTDRATKREVTSALQQSVFGVSQRNRLEGHGAGVLSVSFSPDGQTLASASADGTIKLWSRDGRELNTLRRHSGWVQSISFSPDGQTLASASADGTIKLWSLDGKELNTLKGHSGRVRSVSFSPDGRTVASGGSDGTIKLWSLDGKELNTLKGHSGWVRSVSFSPDGQTLASASNDKTVRIWSLDGKLLNSLSGHDGWIHSVRFSPDGTQLASASRDGTIKLWDLDGQLLKTLRGHRDQVYSVRFSPDGTQLASASGDGTIKLWNLDGQLLNTLRGHGISVTGISFSPDGKTLASASADTTVKLWSLDDQALRTFSRHNSWVQSVDFSSDGKSLVSSSPDGSVRVWDLDGKELHDFRENSGGIRNSSFSPDGKIIATANQDGTIKLWSLNGEELNTLKGHKDKVIDVSFSPDGQTIASASLDETIKLWRLDGQELYTLRGHDDWVLSVSFSPDGQTLASASDDNTVKLWSIGGQELNTLRGHSYGVLSVSFSPDGKTLASASEDGTAKLWSLDGKVIHTFRGHNSGVLSVSFSPDGKTLASASKDSTVKLWSLDGQELNTLRGHIAEVRSISFSPDGKILASASNDKTIKIWSAKVLSFDELLARGCEFVSDYLETNLYLSPKERHLCK